MGFHRINQSIPGVAGRDSHKPVDVLPRLERVAMDATTENTKNKKVKEIEQKVAKVAKKKP